MSNSDQDHSPANDLSASQTSGFFYKPNTIKWILRLFYSVCVILVILDFVIHRHIESAIEKIPAFYAIYGFIACVVLVLIANQMRKVLMRSEDYYDCDQEQVTLKKNIGDHNE